MPPVPTFLDLDEVLDIHRDQIERYGGSDGVRDLGLLESALAMPQAGFGDQFFHADIYEMAAAYLFHIVKNHPFVDGNKRAGAVAAYVFLKLNGYSLTASGAAFEKMVRQAAQGKADKTGAAEFFRKHARKD
ncbi:MAG TPA: type II toxin-antitoxin system death-on-curing family toxin [bacterium]|nr:type II toxin-antitoxin system death-on-curing family toxin [bacterium]